MRLVITLMLLLSLLLSALQSNGQDSLKKSSDTLLFSGQASAWGHYNPNNHLPLNAGVRYLPQINYRIGYPKNRQIDVEASANLFGTAYAHPFDTASADGEANPYRFWARYSTRQFELRAGLQKINFGSATLLRPLMWFDQLDPRDPLKLTTGVWGVLSRYYFLNNANLWAWCLYGNAKPRTWEFGTTTKQTPEFGARAQYPIPKGEVALSYHFRKADARNLGATHSATPEHRIGVDGKWNLGVGISFEGAWVSKSTELGTLTNQELINVGIDNTFRIGNGLTIILEHLLAASDRKAFSFSNCINFSALSSSYPLTIVDHLNAIVYYGWEQGDAYSFVNWQHQFKNISFYLMAYWNPENYRLPQQGNGGNSYAGKGIQAMIVYNH